MKTMLILIAAATLPIAGQAVSAQTAATTTPAAAATATPVKPAKPKLICQDMDEVGTRLGGHRVCKTAEEWRNERAETRMIVDRSQLHSGLTGN